MAALAKNLKNFENNISTSKNIVSFSYQGDPQGWLEVKKPGKVGQFMGLALLGFPSLLGIYAMVYLYVTNISFWTR